MCVCVFFFVERENLVVSQSFENNDRIKCRAFTSMESLGPRPKQRYFRADRRSTQEWSKAANQALLDGWEMGLGNFKRISLELRCHHPEDNCAEGHLIPEKW